MTTQAPQPATPDELSTFAANLLSVQRQQASHLRTIKNLLWWLILWLPLIAVLSVGFATWVSSYEKAGVPGASEPSASDQWFDGWVGGTLIVLAALSAIALGSWVVWKALRRT